MQAKQEKYSYSKLSVFDQCEYRYFLVYEDNHYLNIPNIATDFGTLVHHVEETIAKKIMNNEKLDYNELADIFININDPQHKLFGIKKLQEIYPDKFFVKDKNNLSYADKADKYLEFGIYRLENYLEENPHIKLIASEKRFNLEFDDVLFQGAIDRIFLDTTTNSYIIEDIKTYSAPLKDVDLKTPLQFVIYCLALSNMVPNPEIICKYDLPCLDLKQEAGTKGFVKRGITKLEKILISIIEKRQTKNFEPNPGQLCYWCPFSKTYPNQPEEAKYLCPYNSNWTPDNKVNTHDYEWFGPENHESILATFIEREKMKELKLKSFKIDSEITLERPLRRFIIRK